MPTPPLPPPTAGLSRRGALGGLLLGTFSVTAACTGDEPAKGSGPPAGSTANPRTVGKTPEQDPDIALAASALNGEQALLAAITATTTRHPDLGSVLDSARQAHQAHATLLVDAVPDSGPSGGPASPSGSPGASSSTSQSPTAQSPSQSPASPSSDGTKPFRVPAGRRAALRRLATLEQELSTANKQHAFVAQSGPFARLLASMAAAAAQLAVTVGDAAEEVRR